MFHPIAMVAGVFDDDQQAYKGPNSCNILSHEFYETDLSRDFVRGIGFQVTRSLGPVTTALGGHFSAVPWG